MTKGKERKNSNAEGMYRVIDESESNTNKMEYTDNNLAFFPTVLPDLFTVYEQADKDHRILKTNVIPSDFHEKDSELILSSYIAYLKKKSGSGKTTSIWDKYENNEYEKSPYKLYHDIKIASSIEISKYAVGSKEYNDVDFFYKFSTELLLRELSRFHFILHDHPHHETESELETQLNEDFDKISTTYNLTNGEVIAYISTTEEPEPQQSSSFGPYYNQHHQNQPPAKQTIQPLFSSLIGRSELDTNLLVVPDQYSVSKIIPANKDSTRNISTFDSLSPVNNKIPTPLEQTSHEILSDFFHPMWYTLPVPTWINYSTHIAKPPNSLFKQQVSNTKEPSASNQSSNANEKPTLTLLQNRGVDSEPLTTTVTYVPSSGDSFKSFGPQIDSKDSIISEEFKGRIWLNHIGFDEIKKIKLNYLKSKLIPEEAEKLEKKEEVKEVEKGEKDNADEENKDEKPLNGVEDKEGEEPTTEPIDIDKLGGKEINIANLVQWDPERQAEFESIKQSKSDLVKSPKALQKLISANLLKLNKLRQERYFSSDPRNILPPTNEEIRLYNKITKLISLGIQVYKINPQDLTSKLQFSDKLPVLVSEYNGVLPGVPPTRLGGINSSIRDPSTSSSRLPNLKHNTYKRKRY
ncbi:putative chromatin remodeling complex subunit [Scheffersomyces coipomensis]|uniref:putative chromatin remodeling complex subunit n=1 Tax=Scheffersomyces coipomensis TaxID=1788519 RepID=UPI00315C7DA9